MLISRLKEYQWIINRLTKVLMVKLVIIILSVRRIARTVCVVGRMLTASHRRTLKKPACEPSPNGADTSGMAMSQIS